MKHMKRMKPMKRMTPVMIAMTAMTITSPRLFAGGPPPQQMQVQLEPSQQMTQVTMERWNEQAVQPVSAGMAAPQTVALAADRTTLPYRPFFKRVPSTPQGGSPDGGMTQTIMRYEPDWVQVIGSIIVPIVVAAIGYRAATRGSQRGSQGESQRGSQRGSQLQRGGSGGNGAVTGAAAPA